MSKRFHLALLPLLLGLSASALAKTPETVNIGYQKANIFALLKYRGTLDETFKKRGSPCAGWSSRLVHRCWKG